MYGSWINIRSQSCGSVVLMSERVTSFECLQFCCFTHNLLWGAFSGIEGSGGEGGGSRDEVKLWMGGRRGGRVRAGLIGFSQSVICICKGEGSVGFKFACGIFFLLCLCFKSSLCSRACIGPAGMFALAVGALQLVYVASLLHRARVGMGACVGSCGMWPSAAAILCFPCTPCRLVAPVLALEALGGSWDVEAYSADGPLNDNAINYCGIGSRFGLVTDY